MKKFIPYLLGPFLLAIFLEAILVSLTEKETEPKQKKEAGYDKPEGYAEFYKLITTPIGAEKSGYKANYRLNALQKSYKASNRQKYASRNWNWTHRGPGNVGGRTRDVLIDPDDPTHNTWFAASASGGVWKTEDAGTTWHNLTPLLENLATNCIAMSPANHNVLYLGTGEGYGGFGMVSGSGVFRSNDRGGSWDTVPGTSKNEDFRWINKILVQGEDSILCATNSGIFKSPDGGLTWDSARYKGYAVQWLVANPLDPNTVYAAVNRLGIVKSYDFGKNWIDAYSGIGTGYRFSVAVSPVDTNRVYTSVEAPGLQTHLYVSYNGAESWEMLYDADFSFYHFLGSQGWFNNVICAHPFDADQVFIGGVYLGSIEFQHNTNFSERQIMRVDTVGTGAYLRFVNFGGSAFSGALALGTDEGAEIEASEMTSIAIYFNADSSQLAHRFLVPEGEGGGVPEHLYAYQDYVEVPFTVWDTDNDQQLMVSFRDQDRNGVFSPIDREWDDEISGREYIYIHSYPYNESPEAEIAQDGGHYEKMMYFLWPTVPEDSTWYADSVSTTAELKVQYGRFTLRDATTTILADDDRNSDLHVDHHDIEVAILDADQQSFMLLDANDGGLGVSYDAGQTWAQIRNGYHTTQFYGVAKKSGAHEYIGGMQDNGTWQSPLGEEAEANSEYLDRVAGDGFEVLWHPYYPSRILASSYFNLIEVSLDGGRNWTSTTEGMSGTGPFITRLSHSRENPDLVFAVGNYGVYRHSNFGVGRYPWQLTRIDSGWALNNAVTSSHNVEVSLASPAVVWAGAAMYGNPELNIFVSTDYGETFSKTTRFDEEMGYITAIATHPTDSATAYLLFSLAEKPKVLRTTDLGETWEDISGFGEEEESSLGFPDVMVYSLLVLPDDPNTIWVGTEIGIFERTGDEENWHLADLGNFPSVSVWQLYTQDLTIVAATHGRGIWTTTQWPEHLSENSDALFGFTVYPNPTNGPINLEFTGEFQDATLAVYNTSGTKLFTSKLVNEGTSMSSSADLSDLSGGIYILTVTSGSQVYTQRIVINEKLLK